MPNTREKLIELLEDATVENIVTTSDGNPVLGYFTKMVRDGCASRLADDLIANGVTLANQVASTSKQLASSKWIPVTERLPDENGYYLCEVCFSSVSDCKSYRRMILYWEDNVWIDMPNCFKTRKPTHWMPLPEPPKGE